MRCAICHRVSLKTFCQECQDIYLKPSISIREFNSLKVYSFFRYQNIEDLLLTKHTPQGFKIYRALAKITFRPFIENFMLNIPNRVYIIGVDEVLNGGYSHVALLTHEMRTKRAKPLHHKLISKNGVKYSGKSLQFRLENPREFKYSGLSNIDAILVDDIITTGITLKEAYRVLSSRSVNTLFGLTLASHH